LCSLGEGGLCPLFHPPPTAISCIIRLSPAPRRRASANKGSMQKLPSRKGTLPLAAERSPLVHASPTVVGSRVQSEVGEAGGRRRGRSHSASRSSAPLLVAPSVGIRRQAHALGRRGRGWSRGGAPPRGRQRPRRHGGRGAARDHRGRARTTELRPCHHGRARGASPTAFWRRRRKAAPYWIRLDAGPRSASRRRIRAWGRERAPSLLFRRLTFPLLRRARRGGRPVPGSRLRPGISASARELRFARPDFTGRARRRAAAPSAGEEDGGEHAAAGSAGRGSWW
jgi:hypothetical protein